MREAISRLARKDFRPVIFMQPLGFFRRTSEDVRTISEYLQRQNQQLADEGFSLRAILSGMVEGVMIVDPSQRIRLVNEALGKMFQFDISPINRTVAEVFFQPDLQRAVRETLEDGSGRVLELLFRPTREPAQPELHFEVYASPLNPGAHRAARGAVVVFHDITKLKGLEATRREFVANVSHEFRTPLAIINGYIETLQDGALDDRPMAEKSLAVMHTHCQRLNLLIDDLLTISRLEHQSVRLSLQQTDLREILARVIEQVEADIRLDEAKVEVRFGLGEAIVEADPWRMEQVFFNLLINAFRYATRPGCVLKVGIDCRVEDGFAEIRVSDNGPGIPRDDQPHIFERFYRVHKDRSRVAGGTGLGLSIVKNIILAHGGKVRVESEAGEGAAFVISLPVSISGLPAAPSTEMGLHQFAEAASPPKKTAPRRTPKKIRKASGQVEGGSTSR